MPKVSQTSGGAIDGEFYPIQTRGPVAQFYPTLAPSTPLAATGGGATWNSGAIATDGFKSISVGATLARAGSVAITRYIDEAGVVVLDTTTTVLSAGVAGAVSVPADGKAFGSVAIILTNTDTGGTSALTNFSALFEAA
jgi:hypothetical protein